MKKSCFFERNKKFDFFARIIFSAFLFIFIEIAFSSTVFAQSIKVVIGKYGCTSNSTCAEKEYCDIDTHTCVALPEIEVSTCDPDKCDLDEICPVIESEPCPSLSDCSAGEYFDRASKTCKILPANCKYLLNGACIECARNKDCPSEKPQCNSTSHTCETCGDKKAFDTATGECGCAPLAGGYDSDTGSKEGNRCLSQQEANQKFCNGKGVWNGTACSCNNGQTESSCLKDAHCCFCENNASESGGACVCNSGWYSSDGYTRIEKGACPMSQAEANKKYCNNKGTWNGSGCACSNGQSDSSYNQCREGNRCCKTFCTSNSQCTNSNEYCLAYNTYDGAASTCPPEFNTTRPSGICYNAEASGTVIRKKITGVGDVIISQNEMTWFSADRFCKKYGKSIVSLSQLGCTKSACSKAQVVKEMYNIFNKYSVFWVADFYGDKCYYYDLIFGSETRATPGWSDRRSPAHAVCK